MSVFPKYERYKDSGVEWLGELQEHWELSRSRRVFVQRKELARPGDSQLSATQAYGVIPQADYEERIGRKVVKISMHLEKRKHVEPDDFVISMRSFQGGLERAWARGCIRSSYTILQPLVKVAPSYFSYLFKSPQYIASLQTTGSFIRDGQDLTYENFILVDLPIPPLEEQVRIGAFLDQKTAEIDALIAKKQRQIELLDEQKAILINRAVTRGLDPNSKVKPSSIEWIGDIPEHWEVKKLRVILHAFSTRGSPNARLLSVTRELGVIERNVESKEENHNFVPDDLTNYKVIEKGDFVINKMKAWQGSFAVTQLDGIVSPAYFTFRVRHVSTDFFHVAIRSKQYVPFFAAASDGVRIGQWDLVPARMREIQFVIPPVKEQAAIAEVVEKIKIDTASLIHRIESQIESLKTLRSTLIAHAVIGKIKV